MTENPAVETESARVTVRPSGRRFVCRPGENVLAAALRQGVVLPYSCKNGSCASCRCRLESGTVDYPVNPPDGLDDDQILDGQALLCQAVARTDLEVSIREIEQVADIPVRTFPARVESRELLSPTVMQLKLKLPSAARLQFLAGQYLDILLPGGKRRAFSIASPPSQTEFLELHVRHVDGGGFTGHVFNDMKLREILRMEGPLGTFFVRHDEPERPIVMMGGGTGLAPLKSMLEDLLRQGDDRPVTLYWGARTRDELYQDDLLREWAGRFDHIHYLPVLSEENETDWSGRRGWVHESVLADFPDLSSVDLYMSGPPAMIDAGRHAFLDAGLPEHRLFYDSFDFAPDAVAASKPRPVDDSQG